MMPTPDEKRPDKRQRLDVASVASGQAAAYRVGARVCVEWPDCGRLCAKIVSLRRKSSRRPRSVLSVWQYLLQWDGGFPPRWTRLLHLRPRLVEDCGEETDDDDGADDPPPVPVVAHAWECESGDHAETPLLAYAQIAPVLCVLAAAAGVARVSLRLYDPYYCAGSTARHLRELGFARVYNRAVDCYAAAAAVPPCVPPYDVLVTNPPFSGDHPRRCVRFSLASGRPFLLLLPNYEACSRWLAEELELAAAAARTRDPLAAPLRLLVLAPHKRYVCRSPAFRETARDKDRNKKLKYVAPFPLVWLVGVPDRRARCSVLAAWRDCAAPRGGGGGGSGEAPVTEVSSRGWSDPSALALVENWEDLPNASRPRGAKDAPDALFKAAFNAFCREHALGKPCAEFAFTRRCECTTDSPFAHEPPARLADRVAEFQKMHQDLRPPAAWGPPRPSPSTLTGTF